MPLDKDNFINLSQISWKFEIIPVYLTSQFRTHIAFA